MTNPVGNNAVLHSIKERYPVRPGEVILHSLSGLNEPFRLMRWHKQIGDTVRFGDMIATVQSASLEAEIESMDDGVLSEQLFRCDDCIPPGSTIAKIQRNEN